MSWTKREIVLEAYAEIALAGYVFDLEPEELNAALRRLDTMMAMWNGKGIRLGYPLPSTAEGSDLDDDSNLPDIAVEPVYLNLAIRLAPGIGKQVTPETKVNAKAGYDMLMSRAAMPMELQFPSSMPRGAGNKPWRYASGNYMPDPVGPLLAGQDGEIEFN